MRNATLPLALLLLLGSSGIAAAELVPEDPYADPPDAGVAPVARVAPAPEPAPEPAPVPFWDEHGWKLVAPAIGLLALALIARRIRAAKRHRLATLERRTQFGMSAVDPALGAHDRAAWEHEPAVAPSAVVSLVMHPRRRFAAGTEAPPMTAALHPHPYAARAMPAPYPPAQSYALPVEPAQILAAVPAWPRPVEPRYGPPQMPFTPAAPAAATQVHAYARPDLEPPAMPRMPERSPEHVLSPPPYPLTFPAFPDAAAATTGDAPRTSGAWEATPISRVVDDGPTHREDFAIQFARGSEQQLDQAVQMIALPPSPAVRAAQLPPSQPRRIANTIRSHGGPRRS